VSGCRSHGELIGGYVLNALDPGEMEEMRRHIASCPACEREVRHLTGLPELLDMVQPADVPPPALRPAVEEAVLDRFARERRSGSVRPGRRRPVMALAAVACVGLLAGLLLALPSDDDASGERETYATASLAALRPDSSARATAHAGAVPAGTRVSLTARGLEGPRGAVFQLWCVRADGAWVSGGTFSADAGGRARAELTAAVQPGDYHVMVVTRRSHAAAGARGEPVLRGRLSY
jgi:hypothetical protein